MKIKIILLLLLVYFFTNSIFADYSSLTKTEKYRVEKAFKQSKFYKYYEDLRLGKDNIKIIGIKKIGEKFLAPNFIEHSYELEIDLIIKDKIFKRDLPVSFKTLAIAKPVVNTSILIDIYKIGGGILIGMGLILIFLVT